MLTGLFTGTDERSPWRKGTIPPMDLFHKPLNDDIIIQILRYVLLQPEVNEDHQPPRYQNHFAVLVVCQQFHNLALRILKESNNFVLITINFANGIGKRLLARFGIPVVYIGREKPPLCASLQLRVLLHNCDLADGVDAYPNDHTEWKSWQPRTRILHHILVLRSQLQSFCWILTIISFRLTRIDSLEALEDLSYLSVRIIWDDLRTGLDMVTLQTKALAPLLKVRFWMSCVSQECLSEEVWRSLASSMGYSELPSKSDILFPKWSADIDHEAYRAAGEWMFEHMRMANAGRLFNMLDQFHRFMLRFCYHRVVLAVPASFSSCACISQSHDQGCAVLTAKNNSGFEGWLGSMQDPPLPVLRRKMLDLCIYESDSEVEGEIIGLMEVTEGYFKLAVAGQPLHFTGEE
jgi:hypothetical protein